MQVCLQKQVIDAFFSTGMDSNAVSSQVSRLVNSKLTLICNLFVPDGPKKEDKKTKCQYICLIFPIYVICARVP